ncbi:MAG TPA: cyanophycin synthetase [Kofleriaceae bacterium]|nr:cyanophycin synthetase [Kofleriaceae bacterium]
MSAAAGSDRDYEVLLARLYAARRFGMHLELERVTSCLARLGRPQARFAAIAQVGGTNGKGSTAAFTESMLRAAGLRTALFTSPHLSRLSERFRVAGDELAPEALLEADRAVTGAAAAAGFDLTFFERLTAMAVWAFAEQAAEVAVLEVGLGGRLDATTAVGAGVAAVTGVALDHQEHLGSTLDAIAREKAGIFRPGQRAVVGAAGEPEAVPLLIDEARRAGVAALTVVEAGAIAAVAGPLGLAGAHQRANAACALAVADHLEAALGRAVDGDARRRGLAACRLPGRMEEVGSSPAVVIDGAHNPQAARALAAALRELPAARRVLVLAVSRDKDAGGISAALVGGAAEVVVTATGHDRAMPIEELGAAVRAAAPDLPVHRAPDAAAALALARDLAGPDGAVVAAGSLFLAGEARVALCGDRADPRPVSDPLP